MAQRSSKPAGAGKKSAASPLRFAHPYFVTTPPRQRQKLPVYGQRMLDHVQGSIGHALGVSFNVTENERGVSENGVRGLNKSIMKGKIETPI
jgi:hypothetical protein